LHYQRQMLSRSARGCFVSLLAKDHVFGGEASDFNEQLAGCRSLRASVEQTAVASGSALRGAAWRTDVCFSSIVFSALFSRTSFISWPPCSVFVSHHSLHVCFFLDSDAKSGGSISCSLAALV